MDVGGVVGAKVVGDGLVDNAVLQVLRGGNADRTDGRDDPSAHGAAGTGIVLGYLYIAIGEE